MSINLRFILMAAVMMTGVLGACARAQQAADTSFRPPIAEPAYAAGRGPLVLVDEAHFNYHTADGRYQPFADLLRRDGFIVRSSRSRFDDASLKTARILVIANALAERNRSDWSLPTPSAFSDAEIEAVRRFVEGGGSLLLIADHMPFPGAAEKLAAAFGLEFTNGYVRDGESRSPIVFSREGGSLRDHAITAGRAASENVASVATFTGSAFRAAADIDIEPLLVLGPDAASFLTQRAGRITADTPRIAVGGWYQGAVMRFGEGRVAVFGEAAMFTAQLSADDRRPMGFNAPIAKQNAQFLLNVTHWLSGALAE